MIFECQTAGHTFALPRRIRTRVLLCDSALQFTNRRREQLGHSAGIECTVPAIRLTAQMGPRRASMPADCFHAEPAGDEERVDEMPEEVDRQSDDRQREKELHHGDAGAPEQSEKAIAQLGIWTSRASRALTQR